MNFALRPVVFFKDDIGLGKSLGYITPLIGSWRPDPVALRVDGWSLLSQGCPLIGYDRKYLIGNLYGPDCIPGQVRGFRGYGGHGLSLEPAVGIEKF
jgi:hypothetical protein